ncbi:MAG: hypothetical protein FRX49_00950 [Trebouxia sp. A1-2]|nr:MAG: hypothetical protein FRX49_13774 [Trebouxia sp. A1-2]KAA6429558.1 MAG: hypothetical protein FRX49_00950 [Trebouxia sp. A1-2]
MYFGLLPSASPTGEKKKRKQKTRGGKAREEEEEEHEERSEEEEGTWDHWLTSSNPDQSVPILQEGYGMLTTYFHIANLQCCCLSLA